MNVIVNWIKNWNNNFTIILWFFIAAAIVIFFALKIVKYAELIINKTKLGGGFVGLVFVSIVSSTPELITEVVQGSNNTPSIGMSDDLGANAFSILMLAISTIIFSKLIFMKKISFWNKFITGVAFLLTTLVTLFINFKIDIAIGTPGKFIIGFIPIILFLIYLAINFASYKFDHLQEEEPKLDIKTNLSVRSISLLFFGYSLLLILFSIVLNLIVDGMQEIYVIDTNSAGGLLLSTTTAMPEIIALFLFAKKGYLSAAIASIIGSHIFNISVVLWGDMAYKNGAILLDSSVHSVWYIGLMTSIMLFIFFCFILFSKKIKNKYVYYTFPFIILLTYVIGWTLILAL